MLSKTSPFVICKTVILLQYPIKGKNKTGNQEQGCDSPGSAENLRILEVMSLRLKAFAALTWCSSFEYCDVSDINRSGSWLVNRLDVKETLPQNSERAGDSEQ